MAIAATINGVKVFSDKRVRQIVNTRVEFTDGSWCDVSTGQVVNRGRGEISIGSHPSNTPSETITKGPLRFQASILDLRQLTADASVEPHDGNDMEVTITGPENEVEAIRTGLQGQRLVVEGGSGSGSGGSSISVTTRGSKTVISGRGVNIRSSSIIGGMFGDVASVFSSSSGDDGDTKVTVKVPRGTPVSVSGGAGNTHIGNTHGPLTAHVTASGDIEAGSMAKVELHVQGSGDIRVAEVNGPAVVQIMGSGDVTIDGGSISSLTASVMGSGDVTIEGVAQEASLSVMGSGDIRVAHVIKTPSKNVMGSGDIRVRKVG